MQDKSKLFVNGTPKYIACYEAKRNPTGDRFTVVYTHTNWYDPENKDKVFYIAMSEHPAHPQGFGQHRESWAWRFYPRGSRITFEELPVDCQRVVITDYCNLWGIGQFELHTEGGQVRVRNVFEIKMGHSHKYH
ncbi:hypothetical protein AGMMS49579_24270 [Spirochaetia bacterium]|nr:hypothetical protein AGMMS49579_24270 [Spirochaetia bacterium]